MKHTSARFLVFPAVVAMTFFLASLSASANRFSPAWPRRIASPVGDVTVYQPLVDRYAEGRLFGIAALSLRRPSETKELHGAFWFSCRVFVDLNLRQSVLLDYRLETVNVFASMPDELAGLADTLAGILPANSVTLPLDVSLAAIESVSRGDIKLVEISRPPAPQSESDPVPIKEAESRASATAGLVRDEVAPRIEGDRQTDPDRGGSTDFLYRPTPVVHWGSTSAGRTIWHSSPSYPYPYYQPIGIARSRPSFGAKGRGQTGRRHRTGSAIEKSPPSSGLSPSPARTQTIQIMLGDRQRENLEKNIARLRDSPPIKPGPVTLRAVP